MLTSFSSPHTDSNSPILPQRPGWCSDPAIAANPFDQIRPPPPPPHLIREGAINEAARELEISGVFFFVGGAIGA